MDELFKWALAGVAGLWLSSLTWILNRQVKRIDDSARHDDLKDMRRLYEMHADDDFEITTRIFEKLEMIAVQVARLQENVSSLSEATRELSKKTSKG
jgi:hypothetical protein